MSFGVPNKVTHPVTIAKIPRKSTTRFISVGKLKFLQSWVTEQASGAEAALGEVICRLFVGQESWFLRKPFPALVQGQLGLLSVVQLINQRKFQNMPVLEL